MVMCVCVSSEKNGRQTSNNIGVNCKNTAESEHQRLDFFKISSIYWMVDTAVVSQRSLTDPTARYRGVLDWMIGWLADWLVHCLLSGLRSLRIIDIERLIEGLTDWCMHGWMDRWMDQLFGLLAGQLIDWIDWCAEFHRHTACIFQEPFLKCHVHSTCCQDMW